MGALLANLTTCHSMKSATFETTPAETGKSHSGLVRDLVELVKARLTLLVLLTTAVGFYLGAEGPINFVALLHTVFGTAAAAAGAAALNQWWEYNLDALMERTRSRPVPAGRTRARGRFSRFCFFGSYRIFSRSRGCIAMIMPAPVSK